MPAVTASMLRGVDWALGDALAGHDTEISIV